MQKGDETRPERARAQPRPAAAQGGPVRALVRRPGVNFNKGLMASDKKAGLAWAGRSKKPPGLAWNPGWEGV